MSFEQQIREAAHFLEQLPEPILVAGHLDTDGLCATAIITSLLDSLNKEYSVEILAQLSDVFFKKLPKSESLIVLDGGSRYAFDRPTLVIDHHQDPELSNNVFVLNPLLQGHDGSKDACAATIAWLVAKELGYSQLASYAVLGAVGDNQDKGEGLIKYNLLAAKEAKKYGLKTCEAPELFGVFSHPIKELLFRSHDLAIPGVTRSKKGVDILLHKLSINKQALYVDLTTQERTLLLEALEQKKPGCITLSTHYGLPLPGVLADAKKAATFINACGRLDKSEVALKTLRAEQTTPAHVVLREYKEVLNAAMKQYEKDSYTKGPVVVFNAKNSIPPAIAGTICSIVTRSKMVEPGVVVLALARYKNNLTKVSVRAREVDLDLLSLVKDASVVVGGECGGHAVAAGAVISSDDEERFISAFCDLF